MMRLDKMLAHSGDGTRKEVKEFIRKGFVLVNGEVIKDDDFKVDEEKDEIVIADQSVSYEKLIYIMLNKPDGYISATYDNHDPIVLDLIEGYENRGLFPVGRLDKDTHGLLLITNDGKLAHKLLSPKNHVDKVYYARVEGTPDAADAAAFAAGLQLDDGLQCLPARLEPLGPGECLVTLREGKFHQVKRMLAARGKPVLYLKRLAMGPLQLEAELLPGQCRLLTDQELMALRSTCGL